jgi:hypothetical protein
MARSRNNALEFSSAGSIILKKGSSHESVSSTSFGAIQFLTDATISSVTAIENADELHISFGAGTIIYGEFTALTLGGSTGTVALHRV